MFLVFLGVFLFAEMENNFSDFITKMILSQILSIVLIWSFHHKKDHKDLLDIMKNKIKLVLIIFVNYS